MDTILQAFLTWQFLFLCIGIGVLVYVIRKFAEYALNNWSLVAKESKLWRDLVLPVLPILLGVMFSVIFTQYPYPEGFTSSAGKFIFGLVSGFTSGFVFRMFTAFLNTKISDLTSRLSNVIGSSKPTTPKEEAMVNAVQDVVDESTAKKD